MNKESEIKKERKIDQISMDWIHQDFNVFTGSLNNLLKSTKRNCIAISNKIEEIALC